MFAGESVQAAVIHRHMQSDGPVYKAIDIAPGSEFLASDDSWFHPVNFANGPDGALYMVDFYRMLVEHPEWAYDDRKKGVDWKLGEANGRIWRITKQDAPRNASRSRPAFELFDPLQLAEQLADASGWRRSMAQQLLVHQNSQEALPLLEQLSVHKEPETRIHALWTLKGLDLLENSHIQTALNDHIPQVQVQAIHLAEDRLTSSEVLATRVAEFATSHETMVRFHSILALGHVDLPGARIALIACGQQFDDSWTRIALLSSVSTWAGDFAKALFGVNINDNNPEDDLWFYRQLGALSTTNNETAASLIGGNELNLNQMAFLVGYLEASVTAGLAPPGFSSKFLDRMLNLARIDQDELQVPIAIELLGYSGSDEIYQELSQIVLTSESEIIQTTGIRTLALQNRPDICHELFNNLSSLDPAIRKQLILSALSSDAAAQALLKAIEDDIIGTTEIPEELRHALLAHANETIRANAEAVIGAAVNNDRQAVVDQYLESLNKQTVDLNNGANLFATHCSVCHAINGSGGLLGPDLTNIGSRSDEVLMVNILDPSRMVSYELKLHVVTTNSGEVYSGTISAETTSSVTVRQPDGTEHTILRENIKEINGTQQSIMPEGFERLIDESEMADLIGFLRQPVSLSN